MEIYNRADKNSILECGSRLASCRGRFRILQGSVIMQRRWIYLGAAGILVIIVILGIGMSRVNSFGKESDNAIVHVVQGDTLTISLGESSSTGFQWVTNVTPGLVITSDGYKSGNPIGDMMGMLGTAGPRTWHVTAVQTGTQTFSAAYVRSDIPQPVRTYMITFQVSNR